MLRLKFWLRGVKHTASRIFRTLWSNISAKSKQNSKILQPFYQRPRWVQIMEKTGTASWLLTNDHVDNVLDIISAWSLTTWMMDTMYSSCWLRRHDNDLLSTQYHKFCLFSIYDCSESSNLAATWTVLYNLLLSYTDDRVQAGVAGAAGREGQVQGAGGQMQVPEPGAAPRQGKEFFILSPQSLAFLLYPSSMLRSTGQDRVGHSALFCSVHYVLFRS